MLKLTKEFFNRWLAWINSQKILFIALMLSLVNFIFMVWYAASNTGIVHGLPDAIVCEGSINKHDNKYAKHVFYLVHQNHVGGTEEAPKTENRTGFSWYRLAPGQHGNAPSLVFDLQGTLIDIAQFDGILDNCEKGKTKLEDIKKAKQAIFFITTTDDERFELLRNLIDFFRKLLGL